MYAGVPIDVPSCVSVAPCASLSRARALMRLRDAEVGDDRGAAGEQHVVRLDVAMDDAALVRVGERARDVARMRDDLGDRERRRAASRARSDSPSTNGIV